MDTEAFIRWSLDDSRTVEERYTVELLVEFGVFRWNAKRRLLRPEPFEETVARSRERELNPAYDPHYSEDAIRKAVEFLAVQQSCSLNSRRPVRDIAALGFMTALEEVTLTSCFEATDLSPLAELPALRKLALGSPNCALWNSHCRDYTPLARCSALRELSLGFNVRWPDFTGLGALTQLETLALGGNLLALPPGLTFPNVRTATLRCMPLASRNVADLPQLPSCEILTLGGAERLDGIEKMPALRNLTILGPFESFEPLAALRGLTCLSVRHEHVFDQARMPRDITPLVRLPKLHFLQFGDDHGIWAQLPRDYFPLTEAPALRELIVTGCPPVEMEVAAIQAGLPPCDDLWLLPEPRPLPPLRMISAPNAKHPRRGDPLGIEPYLEPGEPPHPDLGLREREGRWVTGWLHRLIARRLQNPDWGKVDAQGHRRSLSITLESYASVEKFPVLIEAIREGMARLRNDWRRASFSVYLRVPPPENTPAQKQLYEQFQRERDEQDWEQQDRDKAEYLDRLHQLELKKQEGTPIVPEEFSPSEPGPDLVPPWEKEDDDEEEEDDIAAADSDIATKQKPAPPSEWFDDTHPLCEKYMCMGVLLPGEIWFDARSRHLAIWYMGREPDEEIPEDPKPADA
jgi:hypothetical protein